MEIILVIALITFLATAIGYFHSFDDKKKK